MCGTAKWDDRCLMRVIKRHGGRLLGTTEVPQNAGRNRCGAERFSLVPGPDIGDGHRLSKAVAYHIACGNTHVAAAAQFNAGAMHMPVDLQTA